MLEKILVAIQIGTTKYEIYDEDLPTTNDEIANIPNKLYKCRENLFRRTIFTEMLARISRYRSKIRSSIRMKECNMEDGENIMLDARKL